MTAMRGSIDGGRASSRAALVEAALEVFSTKGYEAATVAEIAEQAGVTTGALYAHFDSKLDLLLETLGLRSVEDFLETVASLSGRSWSETSVALGKFLAAEPDRRTLLLLDVIVVARRDPEVAATLRRGLDTYLDAMVRTTEAATAVGVIEPAIDADDVARFMVAVAFGLMVLRALDKAPPSDDSFVRLTDLLLQGNGGWAPDRDGVQPPELARVAARAAAAERARRAFHDAIGDAVDAGHSLRRVGQAANLSHEHVRRLLAERDRAG